jgi:hypothetical protein
MIYFSFISYTNYIKGREGLVTAVITMGTELSGLFFHILFIE